MTEQSAGEDSGRDAEPLRCLLCESPRHRPVFTERGIDILRCCDCHHVFSSFAAPAHYDGFWGDEVESGDHHYWSQARARMYRDFFRRCVAGRSGRLLDMGCGLGFFLKAMTQYATWEAYGCEISPAAARYAREQLGLPRISCGRLEEAGFPPRSFDLITMWDVLDHIPRPDELLERCYTLLKADGLCVIRVPNVPVQLFRARLMHRLRGAQPATAFMQAHHHAHYYSMSSIRRLLERSGFSRVEFVHFHPVQTGSAFARGIKNMCFEATRALAAVSRGRLNFDNLFVLAHKEP